MKKLKIEKGVDYILRHVDNKDQFMMEKMFMFYSLSLKDLNEKNEFESYKHEVVKMLRFYNYIEPISNGLWKLTNKGIEAKNVGGHFKYQKTINPKMTKFEKISLIVAICAIAISILPYIVKSDNKEINELQKRIEVLENIHK